MTELSHPETIDPSLPVFQLELTLVEVEPPVWRRIQTHNCTLAELHEIIQSCMDWSDECIYAFELNGKRYTAPDYEDGSDSTGHSGSLRLSDVVERGIRVFEYEYDSECEFGDPWCLTIEIEGTLSAEKGILYPRCLDGRQASPPEDCGGADKYCELVREMQELARHARHRRHEEGCIPFNAETFSTEELNSALLGLRQRLGQDLRVSGLPARFAKGDRVRVRRGVVHPQYPDIPLGGWVGTVVQTAWLVPVRYVIRWTEETLAGAHPVYSKRCRRDDVRSGGQWLDEEQIEPDSAEQPVAMEQPTQLIVKPLSQEVQDDRLRMVFGLSGDDPLPLLNEETRRQYRDFLKRHLAFPFEAGYFCQLTNYSYGTRRVTVVGFAAPSPMDLVYIVRCDVRFGPNTGQIPLANMTLYENDPNYLYVEDLKYWLEDVHESAEYAKEVDEDDEDDWNDDDYDNDEGDEGDEWDEDDDEAVEDDEDFDDEYHEDKEDVVDFGPLLAGNVDGGFSRPQPFRNKLPPVGRNDACPCGSGKKFKKCCLKKSTAAEDNV